MESEAWLGSNLGLAVAGKGWHCDGYEEGWHRDELEAGVAAAAAAAVLVVTRNLGRWVVLGRRVVD
jgi:hypothetical protein